MVLAKGKTYYKQMAILPFLVSVVVLTSAIRSETGADDRTSAVLNPKTDSTTVNIPCCTSDSLEGDVQVRLKRSPSAPDVEEIASWKGSSSPKLKQGEKEKESHSNTKLRWQRTAGEKNDKSLDDHQMEQERDHPEEVLEVRGNGGGGVSHGKWIAKDNPPSNHGHNPSAESSVDDNTTESNGKRLGSRNNHGGGEESRGINRFLSVGWSSKPKSALQNARSTGSSSGGSHRTRRDLRALKRMLQDAGIAAPVNDGPEEFPEEDEEEEEGRPEMTDEEQEMYEDNVEVPQMGEALSGEATRRQDFSKRPKYYPDWGPKRTWRINMMRVWGKRHLAGYDRNHDVSRWENY